MLDRGMGRMICCVGNACCVPYLYLSFKPSKWNLLSIYCLLQNLDFRVFVLSLYCHPKLKIKDMKYTYSIWIIFGETNFGDYWSWEGYLDALNWEINLEQWRSCHKKKKNVLVEYFCIQQFWNQYLARILNLDQNLTIRCSFVTRMRWALSFRLCLYPKTKCFFGNSHINW